MSKDPQRRHGAKGRACGPYWKLQSANEELKTSQEELQFLNEELNTINARLQEKVDKPEDINNDILNLLSSTNIAIVFLDKELKVRRYTPGGTCFFSLMPSDVGRPVSEILRHFTDETLLSDAREVLANLAPLSKEVQAEDGRWYIRRITPYHTRNNRIEGVVVTFVDITDHKRMEEELKRFASFPMLNPQPVLEVDLDGRIYFINPSARRLFPDLQQRGPDHPLLVDWKTVVNAYHDSSVNFSDREVMVAGRWYHQSMHYVHQVQRIRIYGFDITKRKRAEEALRESESRLNRSQEIAHLGSWELDLVKNQLTWSDEVYRIFGLQPQEFGATYEAFLERVHPDDRAAVNSAYSGSVRGGKDVYEIEHRVIRKGSGEIRWVHEKCEHFRDATGRIIRSVGMVHDITEIKQAEEDLRQQALELRQLTETLEMRVQERTAELAKTNEALHAEIAQRKRADETVKAERQRLNDILEVLPAYVVLLTPDYHVPFANRFFRERFGESLGRQCFHYLFGRTEPCEICETYKVLKTNAPYHWEWTGPDGRNYDIYDFPFTDADGSPLIMEMGIDITDRKRAEEQVGESTKQLRHLSSRLLSTHENERRRVALEIHDTIGACLSAVKFKVEDIMFHMGGADSEAIESLKALVPLVQESIEECRRIQMDLRPPMLDDLGLLPTLSWFCRRFQTIYGEIRIEQEIEIEEGDVPPPLKVVVFRIIQEAMNNTAKHSPADLVRLSLRKLDERMELVLEDNGLGFDLGKIFKSENVNRGLGLTSMRERTELSGGSFAIESTEGKGTTILASWPL